METISLHDSEPGLPGILEALLFVAPGSVAVIQLANTFGRPVHEIETALDILDSRYNENQNLHGLRLQRHHGRVQLTTNPSAAHFIERFLGLEATSRLSRAALETLAIIAYKEPVTRPQIDSIRGVNSDGVLKSLLSKGMIQEVGRADSPGRPILYSVTPEFLGHFGLNSLAELPPLSEPVLDIPTSV
ncbi:MAG: SMC-Scp complex subunit ScpB [Chloroflexi bacterium RBG_16_52_11]|nr:MAG: SMC-Scp complex subunit ScpB [Chloroflexi bacterium RBG_16_52_11]